MTILATLAGAIAYVAMLDVSRPFALTFAVLAAAAVPVIGL